MKNFTRLLFTLLLSIGVLIGQNAFAQNPKQAAKQEKQADAHIKKMKSELGIDDNQGQKIKAIEMSALNQMRILKADESYTKEERIAKQKAIRRDANVKIHAILTSEQRTKFEEIREDKKEDKKEDKMSNQGNSKNKGKHLGQEKNK